MVKTGQLNRRIAIEEQSLSHDSVGGPLMTWSTVYTCWARIATLKTQEQYGAGEFDAQVSHRVTIRYPYETTGMIHAGQRVVYKQRHFKVQTIDNPNESNKVLYLMCIEVQDVDESKS